MNIRPRLLLADDHKLVLEGFQRILEPEFEIVSKVENGRALLDEAIDLQPDVILIDISMPLLNGIDAARLLSKRCPRTKLIIVTMHSDLKYVTEAFRAGASGFILKRSKPKELRNAIWAVLKGEQYLAPQMQIDYQEILTNTDRPQPARLPGLGHRQREVLQLVAEDRSNKEIAHILKLSEKTVEFHRSVIAENLGTKNKAEWVRFAIEAGLIVPET